MNIGFWLRPVSSECPDCSEAPDFRSFPANSGVRKPNLKPNRDKTPTILFTRLQEKDFLLKIGFS